MARFLSSSCQLNWCVSHSMSIVPNRPTSVPDCLRLDWFGHTAKHETHLTLTLMFNVNINLMAITKTVDMEWLFSQTGYFVWINMFTFIYKRQKYQSSSLPIMENHVWSVSVLGYGGEQETGFQVLRFQTHQRNQRERHTEGLKRIWKKSMSHSFNCTVPKTLYTLCLVKRKGVVFDHTIFLSY